MNIYLTGFMGSGKSSVGRALARRLRRRFLDLDAEVQRRSRRTVAELFAQGEGAFRRLETQALRRACLGQGRVVALGGGALLRSANRRLVRRTGVLVSLSCSEARLWSRLHRAEAARPLLGPAAGRRARLRRLLAGRRALYRDADLVVSTTRRTPEQAAVRIAALLR